MLKGFMYFMVGLLVLWILQGFAAFVVDMWPLIKWAIFVGAACYLFKNLGAWGKKEDAPGPETVQVDPEGNAEMNRDA